MNKRYHLTRAGQAAPCRAQVQCPFGDLEGAHYPDVGAARRAFEEQRKSSLFLPLKKAPRGSHEERFGRVRDPRFPSTILRQLGILLDEEEVKSLTVVPFGSALYGTALPGREVHDYDFVVFAEDHSPGRPKQYLLGDLDITIFSLRSLGASLQRSSVAIEALYAHQRGRALEVPLESPWRAHFENLRVPVSTYFNILQGSTSSKTQAFSVPANLEDKNEFKNFKHGVRRELYLQRVPLGTFTDPLDPALTPRERERFLDALKTGVLPPLPTKGKEGAFSQ